MQKLLSLVRAAVDKYNMIEDGDNIAVGVSGGKDSLVLVSALARLRRFYPKKFDIQAISIDLFDGKSDYSKVKEFMQELGVNYYIVPTNIYSVIFEERKEKSPCSLCSKMRRGALNTKAMELGCNKLALGHHADDIMETFLLSLIYEGRLSVFHPVSFMSNTGLTVIRPLVLAPERLISNVAKTMPVFFNCCPANHKTQREYMKNLLSNLEKDIPFIKDRVLGAIINTDRYNMLDKMNEKNTASKNEHNSQNPPQK